MAGRKAGGGKGRKQPAKARETGGRPDMARYLDGLFGRHRDEAGPADALPNAFLIGAPKCGTTSMAAVLRRHRDITLSRPKEPKFFGPEYHRGWDWYRGLFGSAEAAVRIEASTMYASAAPMFLGTAQMIATYLPHARILYMVRHPLDRIVSHWRHWKGRRPEFYASFDRILDAPRDRRLFIETTLYETRLAAWRTHFPDAQIKVVFFEEMVTRPMDVLAETLTFLGVGAGQKALDRLLPDGAFPEANPAGYKRPLVARPDWDPRVREAVLAEVAPEALAFLKRFGRPADLWPGLV